jgi:predicted enzyme related to lactoylglutathione lyase
MAFPSFDNPRRDAMNRNAINWFEIPARDIARAQRFYEAVLEAPLRREQMGDSTLAVFPYEQEQGTGGCLIGGATAPKPADNGTLVYLNAEPSLDKALARAEAAGGRIATPKVALPDGMGFFAHIIDSEGNRVGLHSLA